MNRDELFEIVSCFQLPGKMTEAVAFGDGHINDTYRISVEGTKQNYLLQKINAHVFQKPWEVQENILNVTSYLHKVIMEEGGNPERESLTVILTKDGKTYVQSRGEYYRMFLFISSRAGNEITDPGMLYEVGRAFGLYDRRLRYFPAQTLKEVIPGFHDTPARLRQFEEAAEKKSGRRRETEDICNEMFARRNHADELMRLFREGKIEKHVTHNDTKWNNVLIDEHTGKALCVCDLDTVMPGFIATDFGDAIRSAANTASEDEADTILVHIDMDMVRAYADGFLSEAGDTLSVQERSSLPLGIWIITYEQSLRFLTDYLEGDHYYKVNREKQNLDRARNQLALLVDIEKRMNDIQKLLGVSN